MQMPVIPKLKKPPIGAILRSHLIITFGLVCTTFGWCAFLIPSEVTGGGMSGVSALIFFATGFPVGISYLIINAVLIVIALRVVGVGFALKSVYGTLVFSLLLGIFQQLFPAPLVADRLLATIVGAILSGIGSGIVFSQGGSSGGTDLIALMVTRYRNISPGRVLMMMDVVIISSSFVIFHSLERMIYGFCVMAVAAYVIDFVLAGAKQSYQLFIFTEKWEEVAANISAHIHRGITLVDAQGWYTRRPSKMILIIVRKYEVTQVFRAVKEIDPRAFMSMGSVMGVYGEGFDAMKVK